MKIVPGSKKGFLSCCINSLFFNIASDSSFLPSSSSTIKPPFESFIFEKSHQPVLSEGDTIFNIVHKLSSYFNPTSVVLLFLFCIVFLGHLIEFPFLKFCLGFYPVNFLFINNRIKHLGYYLLHLFWCDWRPWLSCYLRRGRRSPFTGHEVESATFAVAMDDIFNT